MLMCVLSDRARRQADPLVRGTRWWPKLRPRPPIPRSLRMIEGFGVNTFHFVERGR